MNLRYRDQSAHKGSRPVLGNDACLGSISTDASGCVLYGMYSRKGKLITLIERSLARSAKTFR